MIKQDFQVRMIDEFNELNSRMVKLALFITTDMFLSLPGHKQKLMQWQYSAMQSYHEALSERIKCEGYDPYTGHELEG